MLAKCQACTVIDCDNVQHKILPAAAVCIKPGTFIAQELVEILFPVAVYRKVLAKLRQSNAANRKELDWQGQYDAITEARCLVKHHADVVRANLHEFVLAAVPSMAELRSCTAKNGMVLFQEMFQSLGKHMDKELDEIVPVLAKKAGEVSTAGEGL